MDKRVLEGAWIDITMMLVVVVVVVVVVIVAMVVMMRMMTMVILVTSFDAHSDEDDAHQDASGTDLQRAHM